MRLDAYLAQYWPEFSRSTWQKYVRAGHVSVDGVVVTSPSFTLGEDSEVTTNVPEKTDFSHQKLPILYEDKNVIVIDKPAGILTHAKGALNDEFSVAEFMKGKTSYGADTNRPGIIHRLDRDTSGVILCVKNELAAKYLQKQFGNRTVKKTYYAVVDGIPKEQSALIDVPIGRDPKKPSQFRADPNGKTAQTFYQVEKYGKKSALVRLEPKTGRTHQLRVHLAHMGTPIVGDKVYGRAEERMFLHAACLEVTLPGGERRSFRSDIPKEFLDL